jgi:hypothetical protein
VYCAATDHSRYQSLSIPGSVAEVRGHVAKLRL